MLCNGEKLGLMFPTANEWPQQKMGEKILVSKSINSANITYNSNENSNNGSSRSGNDGGERPRPSAAAAAAQGSQHGALKCPRCDSSNTKFCYYNNYSLSQPRHFCKACKRYWTRGGTLRNVPVGGGCRKNKRIKNKPASTAAAAATPSAAFSVAMTNNPVLSYHHPLVNPSNSMGSLSLPSSSSPSGGHLDPSIFYGLHAAGISPNGGGPMISSCTSAAFDVLQPQMSALGLEFSSNLRSDEFNQLSQLPVAASSAAMFDNSLFGSSLLVSSLKNSKKLGDYQTNIFPYYDLQASVLNLGMFDVTTEGQADQINKSSISCSDQWQISSDCGSIAGAFASLAPSDSTYLYWNTAMNSGGGGWPEPPNCGSSVAPPLS